MNEDSWLEMAYETRNGSDYDYYEDDFCVSPEELEELIDDGE